MAEEIVENKTPSWLDTLDEEHRGHAQNKGWDKLEPAAALNEAIRSQRAAEKSLGAPASEMVRVPKVDADPAAIKAFWERLGAPVEATGYNFSELKAKDGTPIDPKLADALRAASFDLHLPADKALGLAQRLLAHQESENISKTADATATAAAERQKLADNWGARAEVNKYVAGRAMESLGLTKEAIDTLQNLPGVGYAAVMEMMLQVGIKQGEARFVSQDGNPGAILSRDQAVARKAELMNDTAWAKRYLDGDRVANKELYDLLLIINKPETPRY